MEILLILAVIYFIIGCFTIWFASNMPWELRLWDYAWVGLAWPVFWLGMLRS